MNFKLTVGMSKNINLKPTLRDINKAIELLDADTSDQFIILEPEEKINGTEFLQILYYLNPYKKIR
jgi:hypothetical protein